MTVHPGGIFRALQRRVRQGDGDEGMALLLVILAMLTVASLSLLVMGTLLAQVNPTQFQQKNTLTANAAEAGLDSGLGAIRNSTVVDAGTGAVQGSRALLPCWTNRAGTVGGPGGTTLTWTTTIRYYVQDPANRDESWREANKLVCNPGAGTNATPSYALLTANGEAPALPRGDASSGNRQLETVYTFSLTNENISGGLMRIGSTSGLCLTASSGTPTVGSGVTLQTCVAGAATQMWAYNRDMTVQLTNSVTSSVPKGMCLAVSPASASSNPVATTMQVCTDGSDARQRWGVSDGRQMYARPLQTTTRWCLRNSSGAAGGILQGHTGCSEQILPDPEVGAGAAGTTSENVDGVPLQWVNYREFGRCLDITDWVLDFSSYPTGRPSEISYPCKQDPMRNINTSDQPGWNEVFTWSASSRLFYLNARVDSSGNPVSGGISDPNNPRWCMRSPNTNGGYVTFRSNCTATSVAYQWTVNRETGSTGTNYTVVDGYGRCLSLGAPNPSYGYSWSSITTATCDGSSQQKWNAPPNLGAADVNNTRENLFN